jgi:glycosyltransferase involved in cell wall biosynthesis
MKKSIKISVIMAVYNGEKHLKEAIESILNQSYKNLEFIIVNDGSSDKSLNIIEQYAFKDRRIIVINHENIGLTKSLNVGIRKASGDFIARMDADDISMPERFMNFVRFLKNKNDVDIYTTPAYIINSSGIASKQIPNYFRRNGFHSKMLDYYNSVIHGALIIRTTLLMKFKYNEEFRYSQDFELYHRLFNNGYAISYDKNNISYKLRHHSDQISNKQYSEQFECFKEIFRTNNKKFYKQNLRNRLFFRLMDLIVFLKVKVGLI